MHRLVAAWNRRRSVRTLGVAAAACVATALPGAAYGADPLGRAGKLVEGTVTSAARGPAEASAFLEGRQTTLTTASNLLCPPTRELGQTLDEMAAETPIGGVGAGLTSLVCAAGLLEFEFHTVWAGPDGDPIVRDHKAVVGVPTPLNVDDGATPDLTGTITIVDTNTLGMVVERLPGVTATLPVSVEAVLTDSGRRVIGRRHLAFGYDARHDRAPGAFGLEMPLDVLLRERNEYRFILRQEGRGDEIALVGGLFDGSPAEREDPSEVRLAYGASPEAASVRAQFGAELEARLTTDRPGPAELSGRVVEGAREDRVALGLRDMPTELTVALASETGTVTYAASAPMDRLTAEVETADASLLGAEHVRATLRDVPQAFRLEVGREPGELGISTDQAIGRIDLQARSRDRELPELPDGEAGALVDATGGELALALRVFGLRRLAIDLDPVAVEAQMDGGRTFVVDAKLEGAAGVTEADLLLDEIPSHVRLALHSEAGRLAYTASEPMARLTASVRTPEPILLGAGNVEAVLVDVPESFDLEFGTGSDGIALSSDEPIGQIDMRARSEGRDFPTVPDGEAGAVLDATAGELAFAFRVFELERLAFSLDPVRLEAKMQPGRVFTAAVTLDPPAQPAGQEVLPQILEDGGGDAGGPIEARAVIDRLPAEISLGLEDLAAAPDGPGGSALRVTSSDRIAFMSLETKGLELLAGADHVQAEINDVPTEVAVELPAEGELARIAANDHIGQLRLAAHDGTGELPARSLFEEDPVANDLFRFRNMPDDFAIALRLTAVEELAVDLDPVNVSLRQDAARTRAVDLDAAFPSGDDSIAVEGLLDKPGTRTSMSVDISPDEPTRLLFDNSHNMRRFELRANGLGSIEDVEANFDNLSKKMSICMDPGPACQRANPNPISGGAQHNNRPYPAEVSMDFDDFGTHGAGAGPAFRTTLNARIAFDAGDPVVITDLRFRNLSMDFGQGPAFSGTCTVGQTVPRIYMFFDSRSHPWVMNSIKYPPTIRDFRIGTDTSPARAASRIAWLRGCTGFLNGSLDRPSAGAMTCGGQSVLITRLGLLGDVNLLNFLGTQVVPVCGGTVPNPQPW